MSYLSYAEANFVRKTFYVKLMKINQKISKIKPCTPFFKPVQDFHDPALDALE